MVLGRNVEQERVACKNDNNGFLTFGVLSFCFVFEIDFMSAL